MWPVLLACSLLVGAPRARDTQAPKIEHEPVTSAPARGAIVVEAQILDASGVFDPTLLVRPAGTTEFTRIPMKPVDGKPDTFAAVIPATLLAAGDVEYLIEAFDVQGNGPARVGSEEVPLRIAALVQAPTSNTTVTTVTPPTTTPLTPPTSTTPGADDGTGLLVGASIGAGIAIIAIGAGIGVAAYFLREPSPDVVRVTISGPTPFAAGLR